jgi:hypothetical protein
MAALFSEDWMVDFGNAWNDEPELGDALAKIAFNSVIGYGFEGEDKPRGVLVVENGYVTKAAAYSGESMNWDLRATQDSWKNGATSRSECSPLASPTPRANSSSRSVITAP